MLITKHHLMLFGILIYHFCAPPVLVAGWFGPSNFSECVEKYVARTKSNRAALILNQTCRMQFDQQKQSSDWLDYYSCVRENLKNVEQDNAASILLRSCQEKYSHLFIVDSRGFWVPID